MSSWLTQFVLSAAASDGSTWSWGQSAWGIALMVTGLWLAIPHSTHRARTAGFLLIVVGIALLFATFPMTGKWFEVVIFWSLGFLTVLGSAAAISMRSPVYAAIWFAVSLLGTAGLLVQQYAQFLGVATMVVYAGAIVVTFLFVVMLAQPEGYETHDRLSWGRLAKPAAILAGGVLIALLLTAIGSVREGQGIVSAASVTGTDGAITPRLASEHHLASLGNELFGVHLVSVELAGTLLLVALVGAIAIMIHGQERRSQRGDANA